MAATVENEAIEAVVARFPGPTRLEPSRRKWVLVLVACAAFVLIGLYAIGLGCGVIGLLILRTFCLKLLHKYTFEAADMIPRLAITMLFVGLLQALAMWSLASRWIFGDRAAFS